MLRKQFYVDGIATPKNVDGPGIESRCRRDFRAVETDPHAPPPPCTMGTGSSLGIMRPERAAEHPRPSIAEVVNEL